MTRLSMSDLLNKERLCLPAVTSNPAKPCSRYSSGIDGSVVTILVFDYL